MWFTHTPREADQHRAICRSPVPLRRDTWRTGGAPLPISRTSRNRAGAARILIDMTPVFALVPPARPSVLHTTWLRLAAVACSMLSTEVVAATRRSLQSYRNLDRAASVTK
jgi:hypothetical protein